MNILDALHFWGGLPPVADTFAGTVYTDIVEAQGEGVAFLYWMAANGGTANSTLVVQACSTITATATTAVAYQYKACTTFDTWGAWTQATTAGFATSGTSDNMYLLWVPAAEIASTGYKYVRLQLVEGGGAEACVGCVVGFVVNPRYQEQPQSLLD